MRCTLAHGVEISFDIIFRRHQVSGAKSGEAWVARLLYVGQTDVSLAGRCERRGRGPGESKGCGERRESSARMESAKRADISILFHLKSMLFSRPPLISSPVWSCRLLTAPNGAVEGRGQAGEKAFRNVTLTSSARPLAV